MIRPALLACAALLPLLATACQQPPRSATRADNATKADCRAAADRVYAAQNRVELSQRDTRDTPFASNYLPGITSRGLGSRFGRDNMVANCVDAAGQNGGTVNDSGTGPVFSPQPR